MFLLKKSAEREQEIFSTFTKYVKNYVENYNFAEIFKHFIFFCYQIWQFSTRLCDCVSEEDIKKTDFLFVAVRS